MHRPKSLRDILSGLIFIGLGVAFGVAATGYQIGTALRMGPGYFPLLLAGSLAAIGAVILVGGLLGGDAEGRLDAPPWRGLVLIVAAFVFFGATVRGLGLAPSLFVTIFLAALASRRNPPLAAAAMAAGLTLLCLVVFSYGLRVTVPVIGPWLRF